jgi:uncharacterized protein (DUF342 family)
MKIQNKKKDIVEITFNQDDTKAFLILNINEDDPVPDVEFILNKLNEKNLNDPQLKYKVTEVLKRKLFNKKIVLVKGTSPVSSENGRVEFLFEKGQSKKDINSIESIDHHFVNTISIVEKNEPIAHLIASKKGTDGYTVFGDVIPCGECEEVSMPSGDNVSVSSENSSVLVATANGAVRVISEEIIHVDPFMTIESDLDYSIGNLDFTGTIVIKGNILPGFKVNATGDISVEGLIEDAQVMAGGDITALGCTGHLKGDVRAGGSIYIKYAENTKLHAAKDIVVEEYLINCQSHSDNEVKIIQKKGRLAGGETIAANKITARRIGNDKETRTLVSVGFSSKIRQNLSLIDNQLTETESKLGTVAKALKTISRISIVKKVLPEEVKQQAVELMTMKENIEKEMQELLLSKKKLIDDAKPTGDEAIVVYDTVYPGTIIKFPGMQHNVEEIKTSVKFICKENAIMVLPNT